MIANPYNKERRLTRVNTNQLAKELKRSASMINKWRAQLELKGVEFARDGRKFIYEGENRDRMFKIAELLDNNDARDLDEAIRRVLDELPIPFEKLPQDNPPLVTVEQFQQANEQMKTYITQLEGDNYEAREELNILTFNMETAIKQIQNLKDEMAYLAEKQNETGATVEYMKTTINNIDARDKDLMQQVRALQAQKDARVSFMTRVIDFFSLKKA